MRTLLWIMSESKRLLTNSKEIPVSWQIPKLHLSGPNHHFPHIFFFGFFCYMTNDLFLWEILWTCNHSSRMRTNPFNTTILCCAIGLPRNWIIGSEEVKLILLPLASRNPAQVAFKHFVYKITVIHGQNLITEWNQSDWNNPLDNDLKYQFQW